jgi:hypothetical protein
VVNDFSFLCPQYRIDLDSLADFATEYAMLLPEVVKPYMVDQQINHWNRITTHKSYCGRSRDYKDGSVRIGVECGQCFAEEMEMSLDIHRPTLSFPSFRNRDKYEKFLETDGY